MLDVSLGGENLNGGYRGGTSFWALTRASGARMALASARNIPVAHQETMKNPKNNAVVG